jgi:hypothetical protein
MGIMKKNRKSSFVRWLTTVTLQFASPANLTVCLFGLANRHLQLEHCVKCELKCSIKNNILTKYHKKQIILQGNIIS